MLIRGKIRYIDLRALTSGPPLGFCGYGLLQIGHERNIVGAAGPAHEHVKKWYENGGKALTQQRMTLIKKR